MVRLPDLVRRQGPQECGVLRHGIFPPFRQALKGPFDAQALMLCCFRHCVTSLPEVDGYWELQYGWGPLGDPVEMGGSITGISADESVDGM